MRNISFALITLLGMSVGVVTAADAQSNGAQVFQENCAICHKLDPGDNSTGPSLYDIFGRKAASRNFDYSNALKKSGLTWDAPTLKKWVTKPTVLVPGTKMGFVGLDDPADQDAVVQFLKNGGK